MMSSLPRRRSSILNIRIVIQDFNHLWLSIFSKFYFNKDCVLTIEECRRGMKQLVHTDGQVTQEFNRDYYGFRTLMEAKRDKTRQ
jgi:hypothetical protein